MVLNHALTIFVAHPWELSHWQPTSTPNTPWRGSGAFLSQQDVLIVSGRYLTMWTCVLVVSVILPVPMCILYIYTNIYICVCVTMLRMYPQFTAKIPTPQIQAWKTGTMKKKKQMYPPLWPWFTYDHHMPSACPCFVIGLQCLLVNLHEIKHNHKTL